jgi:N6-adenosine-specific RNA methylase IME4
MHATFESPSQALTVLDGVRLALAEAVDLEHIREIRNQAEAVRHYLKAAAYGLEMQNKAAEVKLMVERRLGEFLKDLHLHGGDRKSAHRCVNGRLDGLGISRTQSARWQREASLPEDEFREYLLQTRQHGKELTTAGLLRAARLHAHAAGAKCNGEGRLDAINQRLWDLASQGLRFACVYMDPPWPVGRNIGMKTARLVQELSFLPIRPLLARRAHLHLWTTPELLEEGIKVLRVWGLHYCTSLVRPRVPSGFGRYWQQSHDVLLLGARGQLDFRDYSLSSWIDEGIAAGSDIYALIERVSHPPYLEVFGNAETPGWTVVPTSKATLQS